MSDFTLIESRVINKAVVDGFYNKKDAWFTRTQIGEALGYDDPNRQVARLHNRHKERLDPLSVVVKLTTTDGKMYDTFLYSFRGVLEICRWSKQEKANEVMDALYDMAESVREKGYYSCMSDTELFWMLADKCLDNPLIEHKLNKAYIGSVKKMRLNEEKEFARIIIDDYNYQCGNLLKFYNKHPDKDGFKRDVEECTQKALISLNDQCPHLEVYGMRKSGIRVKELKKESKNDLRICKS